MKLSQALRDVARLHAEEPKHERFEHGICRAVREVTGESRTKEITSLLLSCAGSYLALPGDWTARPWMCLLLAEYLEESGR